MTFNEHKLIPLAKLYYDRARPGDWNHVQRAAKWAKILSEGRKDRDLQIIAAYLHDIGWSGLLKNIDGKLDLREMLKNEDRANANTPIFTREILKELNYDDKDIETVIRLIEAADRHQAIREDEEIIVDCDNLSKLCVEHIKEKFKPEDYRKVIDLWIREFPQRVKTKIGREKYPPLLEELKKKLG